MTFNEIEKEFDEQFPAMDNYLDGGVKKDIKSFLKQSFIKCLQVQIEILKDTTIESNNIDFVNGFVRANNENILDLQAQIKLLEV